MLQDRTGAERSSFYPEMVLRVLFLEECSDDGGSFVCREVFGDVQRITVSTEVRGYCSRDEVVYIPRSLPAILLCEGREGGRSFRIVYVFTRDGWKKVEV